MSNHLYFGDLGAKLEAAAKQTARHNANPRNAMQQLDPARVARAVKKDHAKFYGLDNKYDGRGNLRALPY